MLAVRHGEVAGNVMQTIDDINITAALATEREEHYTALRAAMEYERRRSELRYYWFFIAAWQEFEPSIELENNWHIAYLCDICQAEIERIKRQDHKTRDYIINIVPRSLKSTIFNVFLPAWCWGPYHMPYLKFICNSHNKDLSIKYNLDCRRLIETPWYQGHWGGEFAVTTDQNTKAWFENDRRGMRKATSTGSGIYGVGADVIINDDPQDPETAESEAERETVTRHYGQTLYTRINNQRLGVRFNIQQRLHEDDLTGHLLKNNPKQYYHICIPGEESDEIRPVELHKYYKDGLFFPARFSHEQLAIARLPTNLGEYGYASQILQRPSPPEGGTFKRAWWRFWQFPGQQLTPPQFKDATGTLIPAQVFELPLTLERVVDSWDTALDGLATSDDVVGEKWAKKGANKYLLDIRHGKFDYPETKRLVVDLFKSNTLTTNCLIERSSNGPAVAADLREEIPGIITLTTGRRSKADRVKMSDTVPYQAQAQAGNIFLPHPENAPWVMAFIEEHANFPKVSQDGRVDAAQQAINYLTTKKHIWPYFQPSSVDYMVDFRMAWNNYMHYGAVVISKDLRISVLAAAYIKHENRLYVYGELLMPQTAVSNVAERMVLGMNFKDRMVHGIYGNPAMFSDTNRSQAATLNNEIRSACIKHGSKRIASVVESQNYDKIGMLARVNLMFSRKEILVHSSCQQASRQFSSWVLEDGRPSEDNFELCECLCLIASAVNKVMPKLGKKKTDDPHYKRVKPKEDPRKKANSWQMA